MCFDERKCRLSSWASTIPILTALIFVIVALSVDLIFYQDGNVQYSVTIRGQTRTFTVYCDTWYMHDEVAIRVKNSETGANKTKIVSYGTAYDDLCSTDAQTSYHNDTCNRLRDLEDSGDTYVSTTDAAISFAALAIVLSSFITLSSYFYLTWKQDESREDPHCCIHNCFCWCKCLHERLFLFLRLILAFFMLLCFIMCVVSFSIWLQSFDDTLTDVSDSLCSLYGGTEALDLGWNDAQLGISLTLIIISAILSICGFCCNLFPTIKACCGNPEVDFENQGGAAAPASGANDETRLLTTGV